MKILILILIISILLIYIIFFRKLYHSDYVLSNNKKANKLMIVAHPDDETIFGGKYLSSEWKVVCITNGTFKSSNALTLNRKERFKEFIKVMNEFGCSYEIWDYEDNYFNSNWDDSLIYKLLNLFNQHFDIIVTHNSKGEYGHCQHIKLHQIIKKINPPNLYFFHYNENIINPNINEINRILNIYNSQGNLSNIYNKYILHQNIISSIIKNDT